MTDIVLFQLYLSICQRTGRIHHGETSRPARLHAPVACAVFWTCAVSTGACAYCASLAVSLLRVQFRWLKAEGAGWVPPATSHPGVGIPVLQIKYQVGLGS